MRAGHAENSKRLRGRKTFHEKSGGKIKSLNYYGYKNSITLYVLDNISHLIINIIIIIIVKSTLF